MISDTIAVSTMFGEGAGGGDKEEGIFPEVGVSARTDPSNPPTCSQPFPTRTMSTDTNLGSRDGLYRPLANESPDRTT